MKTSVIRLSCIITLLIFAANQELVAQSAKNWVSSAPKDPNASQVINADSTHKYLEMMAISVSIDENYTAYSKRYIYKMRDGQIIDCEQGTIDGEFFNRCEASEP
jgi:hypothetical protein